MSAGRGSARALNVVLYILFIYIADLSVNYVSVCVCVFVSHCVCVCMRTRNCYMCVCACVCPLEAAYLGCIVGTQPFENRFRKCKSHIYLYI